MRVAGFPASDTKGCREPGDATGTTKEVKTCPRERSTKTPRSSPSPPPRNCRTCTADPAAVRPVGTRGPRPDAGRVTPVLQPSRAAVARGGASVGRGHEPPGDRPAARLEERVQHELARRSTISSVSSRPSGSRGPVPACSRRRGGRPARRDAAPRCARATRDRHRALASRWAARLIAPARHRAAFRPDRCAAPSAPRPPAGRRRRAACGRCRPPRRSRCRSALGRRRRR